MSAATTKAALAMAEKYYRELERHQYLPGRLNFLATIIEQHIAPLEARCDALLEALRNAVIHIRHWPNISCRLCGRSWSQVRRETHAEGCIATPEELQE